MPSPDEVACPLPSDLRGRQDSRKAGLLPRSRVLRRRAEGGRSAKVETPNSPIQNLLPLDSGVPRMLLLGIFRGCLGMTGCQHWASKDAPENNSVSKRYIPLFQFPKTDRYKGLPSRLLHTQSSNWRFEFCFVLLMLVFLRKGLIEKLVYS